MPRQSVSSRDSHQAPEGRADKRIYTAPELKRRDVRAEASGNGGTGQGHRRRLQVGPSMPKGRGNPGTQGRREGAANRPLHSPSFGRGRRPLPSGISLGGVLSLPRRRKGQARRDCHQNPSLAILWQRLETLTQRYLAGGYSHGLADAAIPRPWQSLSTNATAIPGGTRAGPCRRRLRLQLELSRRGL